MKPYYQDEAVTLYHGDCRDVMAKMQPNTVDAIITDPVWPNACPELMTSEGPNLLFLHSAQMWPRLAKRAVIQLGCDSDPRILSGMPATMPFFRVCWLEYVCPGHKGRLLYTGDVAYAFGEPPPSKLGRRLIPGRYMANLARKERFDHPCIRQIQHVSWLVKWFGNGLVLDPFCGSGTTAVACIEHGYPFIGIDVESKYLDITIKRIEAAQMQLRLPAA